MSMKLINKYLLAIVLVFASCSQGEYSSSYSIENEEWDMNERFQFNLDIESIYDNYNIFLNVRNTTDYSYSNIFFFVHVMYPDNTIVVDTVEGILADTDGRWLGSGSGKYKNNRFLYKSNIRFPEKGTYVFTVEQAMRDETLSGIASVGMELIKIKS